MTAAVFSAAREGHTRRVAEHVASELRMRHIDADVVDVDDRRVSRGNGPAYSRYNVIITFLMKWIARRAGAPTDASRDHEFTDWAALDRSVGETLVSAAHSG